jgi:hypothetical protein
VIRDIRAAGERSPHGLPSHCGGRNSCFATLEYSDDRFEAVTV